MSQSVVDLADTLIVLTAILHAAQTDQWKVLFFGFPGAWLWPLWLIIMAVGLYLNVGTTDSKPWIEFLENRWILTFLSFIYLFRHVPALETVLNKLSPVMLMINLIALWIYFQNPELRAGGVGNAIMAFSHSMGLMFCLWFYLCLPMFKRKVEKKNIVHLLVLVTSGFLVLQTMTRGVWIGAGFGIVVASYFVSRQFFFKLIGLGLVSVCLLFILRPQYYDRIFSRTSEEKISNSERVALWRGNLRMIQDFPIWGVGFQQNKFHLRQYYDEMGYPPGQRISHAHNQYLQVWAGTGSLGFVLFLYFFVTLIGHSRRGMGPKRYSPRLEPHEAQQYLLRLGVMAALICFMVGAVTEANFNIAKNRILFLMVAALVVVLSPKTEPKT